MKEYCPNCHNIVVGQFAPSETRKWLTGLAKKGGMKAVLTAAGSVVPGFGNISGFIAGTAIDVIYGKDIDKLVDKIADEFEDHKIFVFECPNCGHSWTSNDNECTMLSPSSTIDNEPPTEHQSDTFNEVFDKYLENLDTLSADRDGTLHFIKWVNRLASKEADTDKYHCTAAFAGLYYIKYSGLDEEIMNIAQQNIDAAISQTPVYIQQYYNIKQILDIYSIEDPKLLLETIQSVKFIDDIELDLFNGDFIRALYEDAVILNVNWIQNNELLTDEQLVPVWELMCNFSCESYVMRGHERLYRVLDNMDAGALSQIEEYHLLHVVNDQLDQPRYNLDKINNEDFYETLWLNCYEEYAEVLAYGRGNKIRQDVKQGLTLLRHIAQVAKGEVRDDALFALGDIYEEGNIVEQDLNKALEYYSSQEDIDKDDIDRVKAKMAGQAQQITTRLTTEEQEYLAEYRVCIAEGSEISAGERRLLNLLRDKLGISEERASELEQIG